MMGDMTEKDNSILIVDDEVTNIRAFSALLGKDYKLYIAKTGEEAIRVAMEAQPDLILLDVMLPDMDGFAVLEELKTLPETRKIPVIYITGLTDDSDEEHGLNLGARDFVTKPVNATIMKARVRTQIEIVNAMREIERLSYFDPLTDIPNRRNFTERLTLEWRRAARERENLAFIMIDLDKFKNYNDTYGHIQGDELLKAAAGVFRACVKRSSDLPARLGGEEFGILLPHTSLKNAAKVAERIRLSIEEMRVPTADGTETRATASLGVTAIVPMPGSSQITLLERADYLLYEAKSGGRNRVVVDSRTEGHINPEDFMF